jgi:N-acetylmuramic acid 6-phosphate etherase
VVLTGPEVITGSTRMKAGTATKLVLNTLTTGALVRLGKTYGNLMVDLQAWSQKLVDRGERIVMEVTGASRPSARQAIDAAGGSVRTAIVMVRTGLSRSEATALLEQHDNRVRAILGPPPPVSDS